MALTDKQRQDLHNAILAYFKGQGNDFAEAAEAFAKAAKLDDGQANSSTRSDLLEAKWSGLVRLQQKVLRLEKQLATMEEEARTSTTGIVSRRDVLGQAAATPLPRAPPKYSLEGHRSPIQCVVFHPIYSIMASASEDATIRVWDFETGEYERSLKGHTHVVQSIAFHPNGTLLASSSADLTIKLWDFRPSGNYECQKTLRGHDHNVSDIVFSHSGDELVSCSRDQTIKIWKIDTGYCIETLSEEHSDWIRCLAISNDGKFLASAGNDRTILVRDFSSRKVLTTFKGHEMAIECIAFSNANTDTENISTELTDSSADTGAKPSESAKYLISGSRDKTVRLWHVQSGELLRTFIAHDNWVRGVRFHPKGKYAISVADDKSIRVLELGTGRCKRTIEEAHGHFLTCVDMHPSLPLLLTGGIDKKVNLWPCQ